MEKWLPLFFFSHVFQYISIIGKKKRVTLHHAIKSEKTEIFLQGFFTWNFNPPKGVNSAKSFNFI